MPALYDHDVDEYSITVLPRGLHRPTSGTDAVRHLVAMVDLCMAGRLYSLSLNVRAVLG